MNDYIIDFELVEDTQKLIMENPDASCETLELQNKLMAFAVGTVVKVTSSINNGIVIHNVEEVTDEVFDKL